MSDLANVVRVSLEADKPSSGFPAALQLIVAQATSIGGAIFMLDLKTGHFEIACPAVGIMLDTYRPIIVTNQLEHYLDARIPLISNGQLSPIVAAVRSKSPISTASHPNLFWGDLGIRDLEAAILPVVRAETCIGAVLLSRRKAFERAELDSLWPSAQALLAIYELRTQFRLLGEMQTPLDLRQADAEFFTSVISLLAKSSGMEFIAIRRLEPTGILRTVRAEQISEENSSIQPGTPISEPFSRAVESRNPVSIDSVRAEDFGGDVWQFAQNVESFVVAPILLGRSHASTGQNRTVDVDDQAGVRVYGTLSLASRVEYQFSSLERLGFLTLANGIGLAIDNYKNVSEVSMLRERQIEAGAALQAQEMSQGFRHEIRKKVDNLVGIFATDATFRDVESYVEAQAAQIVGVLDEWKSYARGVEHEWRWVSVASLWSEARDNAQFQIEQLEVSVRSGIPIGIELFCSPRHFIRFVLDGLLLNSLDAFKDRPSRGNKTIGFAFVSRSREHFVFRFWDNAGGLRSDKIRLTQRRRSDWVEMAARTLIFEAGFSTKDDETRASGGGGYGLPLARSTMSQLESDVELTSTGEPGAVFELRFPASRMRRVVD